MYLLKFCHVKEFDTYATYKTVAVYSVIRELAVRSAASVIRIGGHLHFNYITFDSGINFIDGVDCSKCRFISASGYLQFVRISTMVANGIANT